MKRPHAYNSFYDLFMEINDNFCYIIGLSFLNKQRKTNINKITVKP